MDFEFSSPPICACKRIMHVLNVFLAPSLACLSSWPPPCYCAPCWRGALSPGVPDLFHHPHQKLWEEPGPARALGTVPMHFHGAAGPIPALGQLLSEATGRNHPDFPRKASQGRGSPALPYSRTLMQLPGALCCHLVDRRKPPVLQLVWPVDTLSLSGMFSLLGF